MSRPLAIAPSQVVGVVVGVVARVVAGVVVLLGTIASATPARADGAFPESYQVVLPADRPQQIIASTNFGLIISDDGGATWTWTCEQKPTNGAQLYGVSAPPLDRLLAASPTTGLAYSDDGSCSWTSSGGSLETALAPDFFADPTNPLRVWAVAAPPDNLAIATMVVSSADGGKTFGAPAFTAPSGAILVSVESARSDPQTVYVAGYTIQGVHPFLARSRDGGATWTSLDVEPSLGANNFRIVAVDPADARTLTVRVFETSGDSLAISHDGGQTFAQAIKTSGQLTGYVRTDSGTILVSAAEGTEGVGFRSTDGMTFGPWTPKTTNAAGVPDVSADGGALRAPHIRALATRGGKIYAAAKNFSDDWALGVSTDDGVTFARIMRYDDVRAIRACVQAVCWDSCASASTLQAVWPKAVCGPSPDAPPEAPPEPPAPSSTGCGCSVSDALGPAGTLVVFAAACLAFLRRRSSTDDRR
jgi:hypothetical protein